MVLGTSFGFDKDQKLNELKNEKAGHQALRSQEPQRNLWSRNNGAKLGRQPRSRNDVPKNDVGNEAQLTITRCRCQDSRVTGMVTC